MSRVWDDVIQKHVLGYVLLVMGYYNGTVFKLINFTFHREKWRNKKHLYNLKPKHYKKQFNKNRSINMAGYERKKELNKTTIYIMVNILKKAIKQGIVAEYVLTNSWFTCWGTVLSALEKKLK